MLMAVLDSILVSSDATTVLVELLTLLKIQIEALFLELKFFLL